MLRASKAEYRVTRAQVVATLADGRQLPVQVVMLDKLRVGPFELKNVQAMVCDSCVPLLGQMTLAQFDMQSSKVQGVEFLTLARR